MQIKNFQVDIKDQKELLELTEYKKAELGLNDAIVLDISDTGPAQKDPSWNVIKIVFQTASMAEVIEFLMVPTESLNYAGKPVRPMLTKLIDFLCAMGYPVKDYSVDLVPALQRCFSSLDKLKGRKVSFELGYSKPYFTKINDTDIVLMNSDGTRSTLIKTIFNDFDTAATFATEKKIKFQKFPELTNLTIRA